MPFSSPNMEPGPPKHETGVVWAASRRPIPQGAEGPFPRAPKGVG